LDLAASKINRLSVALPLPHVDFPGPFPFRAKRCGRDEYPVRPVA
jgi:hypothetical protein